MLTAHRDGSTFRCQAEHVRKSIEGYIGKLVLEIAGNGVDGAK